MNWIQNIFLNLAKKFGLSLQKTPSNENNDYFDPVSLTATIANKATTLTLQDSTFDIKGNSKRALYLDELLNSLSGGLIDKASEIALGTGDCLIKPYTDGERLGFDVIKNKDFIICDAIGDFIKSIIIKTGEFKTSNALFERFEIQKLNNGYLEIYNVAYKNGKEISINSFEPWSNIAPFLKIANVDSLLFGRYKCPKINRNDINNPSGVHITFGLEKIIENAMKSYDRFNQEFSDKETIIFADKSLLRRDENGHAKLPDGKQRLFLMINGDAEQDLIHEYSPNIRLEHSTAIDVNFRMLELLAGFSAGILTPPSTKFATATEIKASLVDTSSFINRFRKVIDNGNKQLLNAVNVILNANKITPIGEWEYVSDWSDSYLEQLSERFNQLLTANGYNIVSKAEVRAWLMNESLQMAEQRIKDLNTENESSMILNE